MINNSLSDPVTMKPRTGSDRWAAQLLPAAFYAIFKMHMPERARADTHMHTQPVPMAHIGS